MQDDGVTIGIDIGTSAARTVALDSRFIVVGQGKAAIPATGGDGRGSLRDPMIWWHAVERSLDDLLRRVHPGRVRAIAVDGTSGTVLPVDPEGRPLAPACLYNDTVDDTAVLARIARSAPPNSAAHGSTSGLAKLLTLQDTEKVARVLHQADWIAGRFCGRFDVSDVNNALKTGYDPVAGCWPEWLDATGVRPDLLPVILTPGTPIAPLTPSIRARFGFTPDTLIVAGTTDGCASFIATGANTVGEGVTALGSTLVVKLLSATPLFAPEFGIYSHRLGDRWLAGGASNTGGAVLAAFFDPGRIAALSSGLDPERPTGLDYYPLLRPGQRFPINDPHLVPRLSPRPADDARFLQGLLEGIAAIEADAYECLAAIGGPALPSVRSVGGGAANPVWTRIRARRLGVPMGRPASEEAAAGAARLAWQGVGHGTVP
jgi:sugar (pentulose or hexulose) kinase